VLALEALLLLWPAIVGGQVFFRRDVHLMWTVGSEALVRAWAEGSWPLWNPMASFGQPLLADANHQVLYPPSLLRLVMRPWTYYTLYAFGHLALGGAGAAWLARALGLRGVTAAAAGVMWMASGPLLSTIDAWNQLAGAAWMPWAVAAGLRTLGGGGWRATLGWASASALQVLAGAPEMLILAWVAAGLLAVAQVRERPRPRHLLGPVARAAAAAALALGLSAAQWMPALDAARAAGRAEMPREARTHWSVHPANLLQAVWPVPLHTLPLTARARQEIFGAPDPFLPSIYLGAVGAVLATMALVRPCRRTGALAAIVLSCVMVALGRHFVAYDAVVALFPPLRAFRYPAKALLLASLAWSVLGAFGLRALAGTVVRRRPVALAAALLAAACAAGAAVCAAGGGALLEGALAGTAGLSAAAARLAATALLVVLAAVLALGRATPAPSGVMLLLALVDLAIAGHDVNPTAPVALYTHVPAAVPAAHDEGGRIQTWDYLEPGASQRHLGRDIPYLLARTPVGWDLRAAQALALREALFPPSAALWGIDGSFERDVPGLEPRALALLKEAFRGADSPDVRLRLLRIGAVSRVAALHAGAGSDLTRRGSFAGYFVEPVLIFSVPDAQPRAYVVGSARGIPDDASALSTLLSPGFDPAREVVLAAETDRAPLPFAGTARVSERRSDRLVVDVETSGPGWLVVVEAWDPGWSARVDGHAAAVERANLGFRAVAVPAGVHRVDMVFRPRTFGSSLWISGASLALCAGLWIASSRPTREEATA
jgi:Bacterial membrane protein YfhO